MTTAISKVARSWHVETDHRSRLADGLNQTIDVVNLLNLGRSVSSITDAGGTTWTAAQMLTGIINRTGPAGAFGDTTATAADIIDNLRTAQVGSTFGLRVINGGGGTLTVTGGSGVTITGPATVAASASREFLITITSTSTPACALIG